MKTPRFFKIPAGGPAEVPYRLIYNIFFRFAREKPCAIQKGGHGLQIAFFSKGESVVVEDNIFTNVQEGSAAVYIYGENAQIDSQLWVCRNTVTGDGDALDFSNAVLHDKNSVFEDNTLNGELVNPELSDDAQKDFVTVVVKDGKTVLVNKTVFEGTRVTLPEKPTKKGYTFLGWKSTAQWMNNWEIVDDVADAAGSGKEFFTDVNPGDWYYDAVKFVFDNNFMDGVGDGKFNPDGTLTRAMIAQVLYNLEGETSSYPTVFDDVAKSAWYADAVNWAAASGIVEGKGNNKFDPNAAITRQEMAAILYRYSELKGYDVSDVDSLAAFTDADKVASWAKEPMGWAVENYVINGKGNGKLDPTGTATRAEVAQILMNLCNNVL